MIQDLDVMLDIAPSIGAPQGNYDTINVLTGGYSQMDCGKCGYGGCFHDRDFEYNKRNSEYFDTKDGFGVTLPGLKGIGQGLKGFFKQRLAEGKIYSRIEDLPGGGKCLATYERYALGKPISMLERTGVLFGAPALMTKTTPEGKIKSLPKRIGSGITETVKWPLMWPATFAKGLYYELPKGLLGAVT